jgi:YD repeat-containing protein
MILDKSHWHLHGPVSSLRIETNDWDRQLQSWTARRFFQAVVFDSEGRAVQFDQRGREQSVARQSFIYDRDGRPLRCEFATVGGSIDSTTTWHYDGRGKCTAVMVSLADGRELRREESTTDALGCKTTKMIFTHGHKVDAYGIEGSERFYPAPGAIQQTTRYDEEGRPVEVEFADAGRSIVQRVVMRRNAQGRVVMEEARGPGLAGLLREAGRQSFKE